MRDLFNNPWFVVALGVFALGYLGYSVGSPLFSEATQDSAPGLAEPGMSAAGASATEISESPQALPDINWLRESPRDPFAQNELTVAPEESLTLPVLGALFVSASQQTAVVNKRLVRVGDSVDDFVIEHIAPDHVRVSRGRESYLLEPES